MPADPKISPRLREVLEKIPDRAFAERLRKVYVAAAQAVARLGEMDLVRYETTSVEGAPDLSLWEEMAPVIRDTVMDVNALLSVVRQEFPPKGAGGVREAVAAAIEAPGPFPPGTAEVRRMDEAERALRAVTEQLAQQITNLGDRMRSPSVVADRWNLLADLQMFRSRFREMIGDMVFLSASSFVDLRRSDVVPGHDEAVKSAMAVRGAVADLARLISARTKALEEAEAEDIQWHAQHIERDLDSFGRTTAYKVLRAQDKKVVVEFRHTLGRIAEEEKAKKQELLELVRPFSEFVRSLQRVNQREILIAHDREVWAACGVQLEHAEELAGRDPAGAATALDQAARIALDLYGRDPALDVFLRKSRAGHLSRLNGPTLTQELENFRELLANLPMV